MTLKLSEIFIPLPGKCIYPTKQLSTLELQAAFIDMMAVHFHLFYKNTEETKGNLCFAENSEVRPEYRQTYNKADILQIITAQIQAEAVDIEQRTINISERLFFKNK